MQEELPHTSVPVPFVTRVTLRNFRSIAQCDVFLRPLTMLVGRNGAGKSNFLEALRFLTDALQHSLQQAFNSRGGIAAVRRKSTGHPRNFAMRFELALAAGRTGVYRFAVAARSLGGFVVRREEAVVREANGAVLASYRIKRTGKGDAVRTDLDASMANAPPAQDDRLYLPVASGFPPLRELHDGLAAMGFYSLNPEEMRKLQTPEHAELLVRDGRNLPSVIARLQQEEPAALKRIEAYLATIVPGVRRVERISHGGYETLQFVQEVKGAAYPWTFEALSMSDGTLRALGILVAAAQLVGRKRPVRLVGIEEAETALHPAAAGALVDALREASVHTQVIATSHSPEVLDRLVIDEDTLLVVQASGNRTVIAPADSGSLVSLRQHLSTAGELLRMDQLEPDPDDARRQAELRWNQLDLLNAGTTMPDEDEDDA